MHSLGAGTEEAYFLDRRMAGEDAAQVVEDLVGEALSGQWRSFDIYETSAEVYQLLGRPEAAQTQMTIACDFTPARCQ